VNPENWKEEEPVNSGVRKRWSNKETGNKVMIEGGGSTPGQPSFYKVIHHGSAGSEIIDDKIPTRLQAKSKAKSWMDRNPVDKPGERGKNKHGNRF
jgi:hypothetical protein